VESCHDIELLFGNEAVPLSKQYSKMSHDGTLEVEWKGQAFPYLMHHPRDPRKTDSYGNHRSTLCAPPFVSIKVALLAS
jgi:hypothetical protein